MTHWRQTYWSVWLANLITGIGMMSFLPFFPSLLEDMGLTDRARIATWAGVIFGAAPLSATVMSPIWGSIGDRFGRKLMVVRAMGAIALFVGLMAFAQTPLQLVLLRIGQGLFSGFIPPSITLVSIGAPKERQGRVAGDLQTALALGAIVGPLIGGAFAASGAQREVFKLVGLCALASAGVVWFLAHEDSSLRQAPQAARGFSALVRGTARDVRDLWSNARVRNAVFIVFCLQFGLGATNPILELYVRDLLPANEVGSGWQSYLPAHITSSSTALWAFATSVLFGGMAVCNLVCLPLWGRHGDSHGHDRALIACALLVVVSLVLQASWPAYSLLFTGRMLMGAAMAGIGPLAFGLAAAAVAVDRRGGAFGVIFSARTLAVAVGGSFGGVLSAQLGTRGLFAFAAALLAAALIAFARGAGRLANGD